MAPVVAALRQCPGLESRLALTGQHESLVDQILDLLELHPDYDLGIIFGFRPFLYLVILLETVGFLLLGFGLIAEMIAQLRQEVDSLKPENR